MIRKAVSLFVPLAAVAMFLGMQTSSKAQGVAAVAEFGYNASPSLYVEMDVECKAGKLDPANWFYFTDFNFDVEGQASSLTISKDPDGTTHSTIKGQGYFYGFLPVHVEAHLTHRPNGATSLGLQITEDDNHALLYSSGINNGKLIEMPMVDGQAASVATAKSATYIAP